MPTQKTLVKWFRQGARACKRYIIEQGLDSTTDWYCCPDCLALFAEACLTDPSVSDDERLSVEHVPAKVLNGRPMLLTCKACNNRAGALLDSQAQRAEEFFNLRHRGVLSKAVKATLKPTHLPWVAVDFSLGDTGGTFRVKREGAPPDHAARLQSELGDWLQLAGENALEFQLTLDGLAHDTRRASTAWLRYAYLTAFSRFGYALILNPVYQRIRDQIVNPSADLGLWPFVFPSPKPNLWAVLTLSAPQDLKGLLIMMGRHMVHLPYAGDEGFWDRLHRVVTEGSTTVSGRVRPWPSAPVFELDGPAIQSGES